MLGSDSSMQPSWSANSSVVHLPVPGPLSRSAHIRDVIRGKQVRPSKGSEARTAFLQLPSFHVIVVIVGMRAQECLTIWLWHAHDVSTGCVSQPVSCASGMRANSCGCFGQRHTRRHQGSARLRQHRTHSMLKVHSVSRCGILSLASRRLAHGAN